MQAKDDLSLLSKTMRYGVVGAVTNAILYGVYLVLTFGGIEPRLSMIGTYALGMCATYGANRSWTFMSSRSHSHALPLYGTLYIGVFAVQYLVFEMMLQWSRAPHFIAQLTGMGVAAIILFIASNSLIFRRA